MLGNKDLFSSIEVAKILRLSRIAVFKKIKSGEIKAKKVGRNFVITRDALLEALGETLSEKKKEEIEKAVRKALKEYGAVFKKLGKE